MAKLWRRFTNVKVTYWFLFIYIGILLLSSAIVPFINDNSLIEKERAQENLEVKDLLKKLSKTGIAQIDQMYLLKESSFGEYQNQTLNVETSGEDTMIRVFVERKTSDDNKVEAFSISTEVIDGYDISNDLTPYNVMLKDNTLTIISPKKQYINIKIAKPPFPVRQFTGESIVNQSSTKWSQVVYLQIPYDLELMVEDGIFLEFIK
ncbi:hypothetical protein ERL59_06250 [Chengkuizengella sp. YPA3-1-1]|uniref:Uncharacterized protein n=2 Tax=Chengkuizengella marina TaxID=2507566 RepID=A0A6N9PYE9_9BACL|nr:hypothetical protein [Chengkuizengella marina]